eukprot:SAG31_NODE_6153_length_2146_cov_47.561798_2_plen_219_part_00
MRWNVARGASWSRRSGQGGRSPSMMREVRVQCGLLAVLTVQLAPLLTRPVLIVVIEGTLLQLQVYQKPLSAYLYIPAHSAHQEHIQRGWIRGELIRYVKRSSKQHLYLATRAKFWHRLCARGFTAQFLTEIFQKVSYDSRRSYLNRDKQRADCRMGTTKIAQNGNAPQLLALTMPSTQRSRAMKVPAALFSVVQRWQIKRFGTAPYKILRTSRWGLSV